MFLMAWVAGARKLAKYVFTDRAGRRAQTQVWVGAGETDPTGGGVEAIRAGLAGVSDAAINEVQLLSYAKQDAAIAPATDPFDRPTDKLEVSGITAEGVPVTMKLPSLLAANYQSDGVTPLTTGPAAALIALVASTCVSADGDPITSIKRSRRMVPSGLKTWNKKA